MTRGRHKLYIFLVVQYKLRRMHGGGCTEKRILTIDLSTYYARRLNMVPEPVMLAEDT